MGGAKLVAVGKSRGRRRKPVLVKKGREIAMAQLLIN
jgi:hypothetical protein